MFKFESNQSHFESLRAEFDALDLTTSQGQHDGQRVLFEMRGLRAVAPELAPDIDLDIEFMLLQLAKAEVVDDAARDQIEDVLWPHLPRRNCTKIYAGSFPTRAPWKALPCGAYDTDVFG